MASDWVKLHRKIVDSRVFSDHKLLAIWIWCLCRANYRTRYFQGEEIPAGAFVCGRCSAAQELGVSESSFYRGLKKLEEWEQITLKVNNKWTTVSICNWRTYQLDEIDERTTDEQPVNNGWTTDEQQVNNKRTQEKKVKKVKKEKKVKNIPYGDRGYSPDFLAFWEVFPSVRKGSKPTAWHAWQTAILRATPEAIIAAATEFAQSELAKTEFCPGPAPWLNQDRWEDDRESWKRRDGPRQTPTHDPRYAPVDASKYL